MSYQITPITAQHDAALSKVIQSVGQEFGAIGEGFGPSDAEVLAMSRYYHPDQKSQYWVVILDNRVVGGCGVAALATHRHICELKKLYLLPDARGLGIATHLTQQGLDFAKQQGYEQCYIDTLSSMTAAIHLYERFGFQHLDQAIEGSEHNACDVWMRKYL